MLSLLAKSGKWRKSNEVRKEREKDAESASGHCKNDWVVGAHV